MMTVMMRPAIGIHRIASLLNGAKRVKLVRMKAIRVHTPGGPDALRLDDVRGSSADEAFVGKLGLFGFNQAEELLLLLLVLGELGFDVDEVFEIDVDFEARKG